MFAGRISPLLKRCLSERCHLLGMYVKWTSLEAGTGFGKATIKCLGKQNLSTSFVHEDDSGKNNDLLNYLCAKIKTCGPVTVAEYMTEVLTNPLSGYYMTKDVFGSRGDFITSPEISQIFGEMIAVWCIDQWHKMGKPSPLQIVEFGPGRGTLADDLLRVFSRFEELKSHLSLHLVEISMKLAKIQNEKLCDVQISDENFRSVWNASGPICNRVVSRHQTPCTWYASLQDVPREFSIFIAHEFFDALPIHKFKKTETGWREILIDSDESNNLRLRYVLSRNPTPASTVYIQADESRDEIEISPKSGVLVQQLCDRIVEDGGVALIADYGHEGEKTDTFRAFGKHRLVDPLLRPGNFDLTADVDFHYLKKNTEEKEVVVFGPTAQANFLNNLGIGLRLQRLLQNSDSSVANDLVSGCKMLLEPDQMGERFKFMAIYPAVMKDILSQFPPSGFNNAG